MTHRSSRLVERCSRLAGVLSEIDVLEVKEQDELTGIEQKLLGIKQILAHLLVQTKSDLLSEICDAQNVADLSLEHLIEYERTAAGGGNVIDDLVFYLSTLTGFEHDAQIQSDDVYDDHAHVLVLSGLFRSDAA